MNPAPARRGPARKPRELASDFAAECIGYALGLAPKDDGHTWPSSKYREDLVGFARDVCGVKPWERQIEIIEAVQQFPRVAVVSGHKVSKSNTAAIVALWFYCSYEDARVVMSSTTSRQVDAILWRELRMMRSRSKVPIDGEMHELARSGFKSADFREVVGFTAREAEAVAGVSGKNLLYIIDEASGVPDEIFRAIEGNRAGGARIVMFSNGTRNEGEFFDAFHSKAEFYRTLSISSEESPNVKARKVVIPGLATYEWVEEKKKEWGEDSAEYKVRVKGQFATLEERKVVSLHDLTMAEQRWHDIATDETERLFLGVDPAGPGNAGDESAFAPRRGLKVLSVVALRGLTEEAHLVHALGILQALRRPREPIPVIVLDREGAVGAKVFGIFSAHVELHPGDFVLSGVRSSEKAFREPKIYGTVRDELYANFAHWIKKLGGAIPEDARLLKELHAPEFTAGGIPERLRATPKKELRKTLGRSPDKGDAVVLSVWESLSIALDEAEGSADSPDGEEKQEVAIDPYGAVDMWQRRG